ncbi:PP2C family protein-serine/threonine phosphatase [Streptomyces sp. NPDC005009]
MVLLGAGVIFNVVTPPDVAVGATFAAAPLAAGALWTFRGTLLVAIASVSTLALLLWWEKLTTGDSLLRLGTIVTVSLLSLIINQALRMGEARLASFREVAEAVQVALLPAPPPRIGRLLFATRYETAHADAQIGGDLYGVQQTPYGVRFLVGDVRGKGLEAIGSVSTVLGAFHEAADTEPELGAAMARIDQALLRDRARLEGNVSEGFVTAVLAEVPADDPHSLRVVNRGHPAPLLLSSDGSRPRALEPESYSLPLGLGDLDNTLEHEAQSCLFPPGALLLLYTDGVTEARDGRGAFYDPADRLADRSFNQPAGLLDDVVTDVRRHTGGHNDDDMALLAVMNEPADSRAGAAP